MQVTAVTSELSDERFRGDAVGQALDVERAERLRLSRDNRDLQVGPRPVICYFTSSDDLIGVSVFVFVHRLA